jgi:MFS family permease
VPEVALLGAALTGLGYSLVYPGFGLEAVRRVPDESRGLAMGAYTAFLDFALGASGPLLGLIASGAGLPSVFLISALATLTAVPIATRLLNGGPLETRASLARRFGADHADCSSCRGAAHAGD